MTFQLIDHPALKPRVQVQVEDTKLLPLIKDYEYCSEQLELIAEQVPNSLEEAERLDIEETKLHDLRAALLGEVTDHAPNSLDDVKALLKLWHIEKIVEQPKGAVTVSDNLVLKICEYLDVV